MALLTAESAARNETRRDPHPERVGLPTLLLVEDDADVLEALADCLEGEGYAIQRARNGQEGLDRLAEALPDLVLLDLMMPVMDGAEFSVRMRERADSAGIPIIILSAEHDLALRARTLGIDFHLGKPFELDELLAMVTRALATRGG